MTDFPFGFALPGGGAPDPHDPQQMARFLSQLQQMLTSPGSGPVNWQVARQVAESQLGSTTPLSDADRSAVVDALHLADLWLDPVASFPSGVRASVAWTRADWLSATLDVWRKLCDPVAERMVTAMSDLVPEQMRGQLGPMTAMVQSVSGTLFGGQLGQALGSLASEVLAASDIGLPLGPAGTAALLPANIATYGEGLELPADEVRLYVALREAAHQRLFGHVPWLRGHVLAAVETYAQGIKVNREAVEEAMGRFDPARPETMQEITIDGVFTPDDTPQQRAALSRIETSLALVEGWVTHIVDIAISGRLPHVVQLAEAFRRRRAEGGPAEQTFAALVGLELRPRRLREATALWQALTDRRGAAARDEIWAHPDLLPSGEDFADPEAFAVASSFDLSMFDFTDESNTEGKADNDGDADGEQPPKDAPER